MPKVIDALVRIPHEMQERQKTVDRICTKFSPQVIARAKLQSIVDQYYVDEFPERSQSALRRHRQQTAAINIRVVLAGSGTTALTLPAPAPEVLPNRILQYV